jgi:hypothetical protein
MKPTVSGVWSALVVVPLALGLGAHTPEVRADPLADAQLAGRWMLTVDLWGTPSYYKLELTQQGNAISGDFGGDKLDGTVRGNTVEFLAKDSDGGTEQVKATETPTHIIAMGLDGSLDGAFRFATSNMASWLADDYKLTPSEVAQVMGTASEYRVSEVADRNAGMVMRIAKDRLRTLTPGK